MHTVIKITASMYRLLMRAMSVDNAAQNTREDDADGPCSTSFDDLYLFALLGFRRNRRLLRNTMLDKMDRPILWHSSH